MWLSPLIHVIISNKISPGENGSTATFELPFATDPGMSFPVRLNRIHLWAIVAFPILLTMLSGKVLLYTCNVSQSPCWIMMNTTTYRANINLLPCNLIDYLLLQFPWQIVPSPMELQILVSPKPFAADLTDKSVCCRKRSWWQRYHFCIRICNKKWQISNWEWQKEN